MIQLIIGIIIGIFIATVGIGGVLKVFDHGVEAVKEQSREMVK
jgi:uncharacterized iron-regulated membrane protein